MRCSFCGSEIPEGTGKLFVRRDGSLIHFCSRKCEKSMLKLKRDPKRVKWTKAYKENK